MCLFLDIAFWRALMLHFGVLCFRWTLSHLFHFEAFTTVRVFFWRLSLWYGLLWIFLRLSFFHYMCCGLFWSWIGCFRPFLNVLHFFYDTFIFVKHLLYFMYILFIFYLRFMFGLSFFYLHCIKFLSM